MPFFVNPGRTHSNGRKRSSKRQKPAASGKSAKARMNHRKVVVFASLLAVLGFTSLLFILIAPPPLAPGAVSSLYALDNSSTADTLFDTRVPIAPNRWHYIYIHHSRTPGGDADSLQNDRRGVVDHFIIGNGTGSADGELLIGPRWNDQRGAEPPAYAPAGSSMAPDCISISLVGDFDQATPNPMQYARLTQLVHLLQARCNIGSQNVVLSVGKYFPTSDFEKVIANRGK